MRFLISLFVIVCAVVPTAHSQEDAATGVHLEAGYQHIFLGGGTELVGGVPVTVPDLSQGVLMLRAGYDLTQFFTLEAEAFTGLYDDDGVVTIAGDAIPFETRIERGFAVYGKFWASPFEGGIVFARLGAGAITGKTSAFSETVTDTGDGLAYGVGGEIAITNSLCLRLDLTQYRDGDDSFEAVGLSLVNHF